MNGRELERVTIALYRAAHAFALGRGLILADTKFEFGFADGKLTLIDEALTPDSSRYWDAAKYKPGSTPVSYQGKPGHTAAASRAANSAPVAMASTTRTIPVHARAANTRAGANAGDPGGAIADAKHAATAMQANVRSRAWRY